MRTVACALALTASAALPGCGGPTVSVSATPGVIVEPPEATLNGVAGSTATVCGPMFGECGDVFGPPSSTGLPLVGPPYHLMIPEGSSIEYASAWLEGPPRVGVELPLTETELGQPPSGAYAINVDVWLPGGNEVVYQWGVDPGD